MCLNVQSSSTVSICSLSGNLAKLVCPCGMLENEYIVLECRKPLLHPSFFLHLGICRLRCLELLERLLKHSLEVVTYGAEIVTSLSQSMNSRHFSGGLNSDVYEVVRGVRTRIGGKTNVWTAPEPSSVSDRAIEYASCSHKLSVVSELSHFLFSINRKLLPRVWPSLGT
jgi:hypothetical protein